MKKMLIIASIICLFGCGEDHYKVTDSKVPDSFLRSETNDIVDTTFVRVSNCIGSITYKIPFRRVEYINNKILVTEAFTGREYVFNGKQYKAVIDRNDMKREWGCQ